MVFTHLQGSLEGLRASRRSALESAAVKRVAAHAEEGEDKSGRWSGRGPIILITCIIISTHYTFITYIFNDDTTPIRAKNKARIYIYIYIFFFIYIRKYL